MRTLKLSTVAAFSALGTVVCFVLGAVAMGSSGVADLIPETGRLGRNWITAVDQAGRLFFVGAWLVVLVGFLGIVALVGFYDTLRLAGPVMILAPILGAVGLTLVTLSHLIPIAMAYELVPAYIAADPAGQATLAATADTFAAARDQRCRKLRRLGRGHSAVCGCHSHHPRTTAVDRLARPACRSSRRMVGAAQPCVVGHLGYFHRRLHRLLHFHVEHGHRPASAPLTSRRSNPDISTRTDLTKPAQKSLELTDPNTRQDILPTGAG